MQNAAQPRLSCRKNTSPKGQGLSLPFFMCKKKADEPTKGSSAKQQNTLPWPGEWDLLQQRNSSGRLRGCAYGRMRLAQRSAAPLGRRTLACSLVSARLKKK